jgi:hypothetical protein
MSPLLTKVSQFWSRVQGGLFPALEEAEIEMTPKLYRLIALLDLLQIEHFVPLRSPYQVGAKPKDRRCLARAFVAKAFYNMTDTKAFLERLLHDKDLRKVCGWVFKSEVPSESTFSRAFAWFSDLGLTDQVQAAQVQAWLGDEVLRNVSTDSTAIEAREKPVTRAKPPVDASLDVPAVKAPSSKKAKPTKKTKKTAKEKKTAELAAQYTPAESTRLERQITQVPEIALLELPTACDVGCKTNSKGNKDYWIGYKFHVRVTDGNLPLVAVTTAASVHDSQVAIPLMQLSDRIVTSLYELMDRGYDAKWIRRAAVLAGHVPIIDYIRRRGQERAQELEPDRAEHYKGRTVAERFNARLKDEFGGNHVRVRGDRKVHAHLMFGLLVIFADQLLRSYA